MFRIIFYLFNLTFHRCFVSFRFLNEKPVNTQQQLAPAAWKSLRNGFAGFCVQAGKQASTWKHTEEKKRTSEWLIYYAQREMLKVGNLFSLKLHSHNNNTQHVPSFE